MKYYRFPENIVSKFFVFFLTLILLLLARDTIITHCLVGLGKSYVITIIVLLITGFAFLVCNRTNLKSIVTDKRIVLLIIITLVYLVPMVIKQDWQAMYFSILLGSYVAIFLSFFITYQEIARCYICLMTFFSVYSLLASFVLRPMSESGLFSTPIFINSANVEFYNFLFSFPTVYLVRTRNFGFFREPGVYQFFLLLALYVNNYSVVWKKTRTLWINNIIIAVTMVTTFSTNGVVELVLFFAVLFFDKKLYEDRIIRWFYYVGLLIIIAVVIYSAYVGNELFTTLKAMVEKLYTINGSSGPRYEAIYTDLMIFLHNPIVGADIAYTLQGVAHNTSSTLILYAIYGILGGTLNVVAWFVFSWKKNRKIWVNLAYALIFFMSFNTQNLTWDIMFWLFPMMALTERIVPWLEEKYPRKR